MGSALAGFLEQLRLRRSGPSGDTRLSDIELELLEGTLRIHYQPVVDLATREVFAYEALARSTTARFEDPLQMFTAAMAAGCCGALGRSFRQIAVDGCPNARLFININPNE